MTHRRLAWTFGLLVTLIMSPRAIGQQRPLKPVVATATLAGTLVTDESSPRPVRRAVLRLTGADDG